MKNPSSKAGLKPDYCQLRASRGGGKKGTTSPRILDLQPVMTLNEKIGKVINEIKQLNKEKASSFGISLPSRGMTNDSFNEKKDDDLSTLFERHTTSSYEQQYSHKIKSTSTAELGKKLHKTS